MSQTIFITGATGFVGGAILSRLGDGPHRIRALVRNRTSAEMVAAHGAEPVIGDLRDSTALRQAMTGCDVVFHVAGMNANCLKDPSEMFATNVDGTRALVREAARAGVGRVVYTSSAATLGEVAGTIGTESSPHRGSYLSEYERSKHLAEEAAFEEAGRTGLDIVSVNPSSVQGPGRTRGSAKLFLYVLNTPFAVLASTTVSIVDIDDCAEGHLAAARHGVSGERYILNGASMRVESLLDMMRTVTGARHRAMVIPVGVARTVGWPLARLAGRADGAAFCPEVLATLVHGHRYDGGRAVADLGLVYRPTVDTLARTIEWYVRFGFVKRELPNFPVLD